MTKLWGLKLCYIVTPACLHHSDTHFRITAKLPKAMNMFLIAKLNLVSGMFIGAATVMVMKQLCKDKKNKRAPRRL